MNYVIINKCQYYGGKIKLLQVLYVGIGGFIGAALRYLISQCTSKACISQMPYGTLIVNVIGAILIGFIMELSLSTNSISPNMRLFLTTGIMGGLTTFSSFSYETMGLFSKGNISLGLLNVCLNLFLSLGGVLVGQYAAHKLI